jgi:hypothetical protein
MTLTRILLAIVLLACARPALAQVEREEIATLEIGAAAEQNLKGGGASFGPSVAVEVTPIENWLELEAGVSPMFQHGQTEWDTDFLFKKPWTLTKTVEFMAGVGPEWAHTVSHGKTMDTIGAEAALDFMFWPWGKSRFGWYLEPSYGYSFASNHEQSLSVSAGLLIKIP